MWRGQAGRCFYCLRALEPFCSIDHFVPYSQRTSVEYMTGGAEDLRYKVACCKRTNQLLADLDTRARLALVFPGFGVQIGGSVLSPRAQVFDCLDAEAPRTEPALLRARHHYVRGRLRQNAEAWPLLLSGLLPGGEPCRPDQLREWRLQVRSTVEAGRSAVRSLARAEEGLGKHGLVRHAAEFADADFDQLMVQVDTIVASGSRSDDVSSRFRIAWDQALGLHVQRCNMQWRVLETTAVTCSWAAADT